MGLKSLEDVTYFRLNNEINRPVNGQIPLNKDKEALKAFFLENVIPNTMTFESITCLLYTSFSRKIVILVFSGSLSGLSIPLK